MFNVVVPEKPKEQKTYVDNWQIFLVEPKFLVVRFRNFKDVVPIEKLIEEILTHEVLHLVIEQLEGVKPSFMLDNIVRWILEKKEFKIEIATKEKRKS